MLRNFTYSNFSLQETCHLNGKEKSKLHKCDFFKQFLYTFFIEILVFLNMMHFSGLKMLTEWQLEILKKWVKKILTWKWKNLPEFLEIRHNPNADVTLLYASITVPITFSVDTLEDILLLLQNLLTDRNERPHIPAYLFFKKTACLFVVCFWFSSIDSILMQAIFDLLYFKNRRRVYQYNVS